MAATIQNIELPKKPRALDSSTSIQEISQELLRNADFSTNESETQTYLNGGVQFDDWVEQQSSGLRKFETVTGGIRCTAETVTTETWHQRIYQTLDASQQVVGQTYKVKATVLCSRDANFRFNVQETNATDSQWSPVNYDVDAGVDRTIEVVYTCTDATSQVLSFFPLVVLTAGQYYEVKNVSLKEVESFSNNNHGKIYSGRALEFDGVSDYLIASADVDTEMPHMAEAGTFTVACWIKLDSLKDSPVWYTSKTDGNDRTGLTLGNEGEISFVTYTNSTYSYKSNTPSQPINIDTWYRVICVSTTGSQQLYINGVELTGTVAGDTNNLASIAQNRFSIGQRYDNNPVYFNGMMSDFQSWDAAWSADDIAYDFANPESLALNASGTALTESNLKLWYPMQDGHRGQQSYILDGANTGYVNRLTDRDGDYYGDMEGLTVASGHIDNASGYRVWSKYNNSTLSLDNTIKYSGSSALKIECNTGDSFSGVYSAYNSNDDRLSTVAGQTYRISGYIYRQSGSDAIVLHVKKGSDGQNWGLSGTAITPTSNGVWEFFEVYYTAPTTGDLAYLLFSSSNSDNVYNLDNVEWGPINDKHHATTVFLGDEMWDLADNSVANWTAVAGSSAATIGGSTDGVKLTFGGTAPTGTNVNGSNIALKDTSTNTLTTDLTIGRTYKLSGKFATDVAGATNAPRPAVWTSTSNYASSPTVPATNLVLNPGFETAGGGGADIWANWTETAGSGTLANNTTGAHNGNDCASMTTVSGNYAKVEQNITVTEETTYLLSYWSKNTAASTAGDIRHQVIDLTADPDADIIAITKTGNETSSWKQNVIQFTTPTNCVLVKIVFYSPSGNHEAFIDDFMLTAFVEKEIEFVATHATDNTFNHFNCEYSATNEMIQIVSDANNSTFASGIGNWLVTDASGGDAAVTHSSSDGGFITINDTTDNETEGAALSVDYIKDIEIGRSYTVLVEMKAASGTPQVIVGYGGNNAAAQAITTSAVTYTYKVTPTNTTSSLTVFTSSTSDIDIYVYNVQVFPHCNLYVDDISFKEVGVASGWTDADQQLDIAQPALQSYNEMLHSFDSSNAGFNAVTLVKVDDNAALDIGTVDFSVSLWFKTDVAYGNYTALIRKGGWGSDGYSLGFTSGNKLAINIANYAGVDHVDNYNDWGYTDTAIELGKWHHVVGVWDRSAGMTLYLNGVAQTMLHNHNANAPYSENLDSASDLNMYSSSSGATGHFAGCINEVAFFKNRAIGAANVLQLYNDGKALDATLCDDASYLKGYWRNNGLSTWENQILVPALVNFTSTAILLNEALDDSEDEVDVDANHGFIVDDVIVVDSEEMLIISVSTNTLTVARGYNSTTAAAHDNDSAISVYKNGTVIGSETLLIPQGVDGSRDAQGFIMNRARNTSSLNLTKSPGLVGGGDSGGGFVEISDNSALDFGTGAFTIEAWVKYNYQLTGSVFNVIMSLGGHSTSHATSAALMTHNDPENGFFFYIAGATTGTYKASPALKKGDWYHVVGTRAADGTAKLYQDGVEKLSGTGHGGSITNAEKKYIGRDSLTSRGYKEAIDGAKIYNKALSAAEVLRNYNATKGSHRN